MYDTKKFFNDRAAIWDKVAETQDPEKLCVMLILSDIRPGSLILDIGCGTGALEPYLLAYSPKKVMAVDFAPNMIEEAKAKLEHPSVEFRCADFFELSGIQADYAFFVSSFPHFSNQRKALEQAASLLRPGGRLSISNIQGKYCGDSADILNPMLPAQGLINILRPLFRIDVIIDNRAMFLISGVKLQGHRRDDQKEKDDEV